MVYTCFEERLDVHILYFMPHDEQYSLRYSHFHFDFYYSFHVNTKRITAILVDVFNTMSFVGQAKFKWCHCVCQVTLNKFGTLQTFMELPIIDRTKLQHHCWFYENYFVQRVIVFLSPFVYPGHDFLWTTRRVLLKKQRTLTLPVRLVHAPSF